MINESSFTPIGKINLMGSPANNAEAEDVMAVLIEKANQAGGWKPVPLPEISIPQYSNRLNIPPIDEGLKMLQQSGMAKIIEVDGQKSLEVTDSFLEFVRKRSK